MVAVLVHRFSGMPRMVKKLSLTPNALLIGASPASEQKISIG